MFVSRFFIIKALTNMHVGSGERNFSVVDNCVQRDEVTQVPIVQASSLKGALREFAKAGNLNQNLIRLVFGEDGASDGMANKNSAGEFRFLQAGLLGMPMRSTHRPFYLATTKEIIKDLAALAGVLGVGLELNIPEDPLDDECAYVSDPEPAACHFIEDFPCKHISGLEPLKTFLGYDHVALFTDKTFKEITSILPVITRNKIGEDGISENLFYEEIIPRQSIFGFFICMPSNEIIEEESRKKINEQFETLIELMTTGPVQIGANASIGYGLTKITEVT